jgi:ABC-type polysaccharide/polyol phosphate export permease
MSQLKCCLGIIRKELFLFFKDFKNSLIDISIILATNMIVFSYFMSIDMGKNFSNFIFVGAIASFGLFESVGRATFLAQEATDRKITRFLILPVSSASVFTSIALSWAICSTLLVLTIFPLGKLLLWHRIDFTNVDFFKFGLIFIVANIFYGFFSLWIASLITNLRNSSWLWARLINPLFMFCGYYYSWKAAYDLSPFVGYAHFLNPLLYVLEGTKAAFLGQSGFLPFWICFFALWVFVFIFRYDAIRRFKKRLDCV